MSEIVSKSDGGEKKKMAVPKNDGGESRESKSDGGEKKMTVPLERVSKSDGGGEKKTTVSLARYRQNERDLGHRTLAKVVHVDVCSPRFRRMNIGQKKKWKENKGKKPDSKGEEKKNEKAEEEEEPPFLTAVMKVDIQSRQTHIKLGQEILTFALEKSPENRATDTEFIPNFAVDPDKNLFTVQGRLDMAALAKWLTKKLKLPVEIVPPPEDYQYSFPCRRNHSEPSEADTPYMPPPPPQQQ